MRRDELETLRTSGVLTPLDWHFARLLERLASSDSPELALAAADLERVGVSLHLEALAAAEQGEEAAARARYAQAVEIFRDGGWTGSLATTLANQGNLLARVGERGAALACFDEALQLQATLLALGDSSANGDGGVGDGTGVAGPPAGGAAPAAPAASPRVEPDVERRGSDGGSGSGGGVSNGKALVGPFSAARGGRRFIR